jgi:hypothetical protein
MFKLILILQLLIVVVISFRSPLSSSSLLLKTKTILQLNCVEEKVSTSTPSEQEKYQLFAGNLPFSLSNDELKQIVADRVGLNSGKFNAKIALDKKTGKSSGNINKISTILIQDIDTVAQILKLSIRDLPDPLITADAYDRLLKLTSLLSSDSSMLNLTDEMWEQEAMVVLSTMPLEHKDTLINLLKFLIVIRFLIHSDMFKTVTMVQKL